MLLSNMQFSNILREVGVGTRFFAARFFAPIALLCAVAGQTVQAAGEDAPTIYGIKMMEPISIPECGTFADPTKFGKRYGVYPYAPPTNGPCYRRDDRAKSGTSEPLIFENIEIQYPRAAGPELAYGVRALMLDGKVQAMRWLTRGLSEQGPAFYALKAKFGEPSSMNVEIKQNGFGAKVDSINATWFLSNTLTMIFTGVDGKIDQGKVEIMSEGARVRVQHELSIGNKRIPL